MEARGGRPCSQAWRSQEVILAMDVADGLPYGRSSVTRQVGAVEKPTGRRVAMSAWARALLEMKRRCVLGARGCAPGCGFVSSNSQNLV